MANPVPLKPVTTERLSVGWPVALSEIESGFVITYVCFLNQNIVRY